MIIFYGNKSINLPNATLTPAQALEVVKAMGNPEFTTATAIDGGNVMLSVAQATKG